MGIQKEIKERFLGDIADHEMTVIRDDGVSRHIRFRKPGTCIYGFDLITWPGLLCYTGDMGTFVFSRIEDMFKFFRCRDKLFTISTGYWAEKVIASDRSGIRQYSPELFVAVVEEWFRDSWEEELSKEEFEALHERLKEEVLSVADNEYDAMRAAMEFEHDGQLVLQDFWEANVEEYTPTFLWCCHAIQWGISIYDEERKD